MPSGRLILPFSAVPWRNSWRRAAPVRYEGAAPSAPAVAGAVAVAGFPVFIAAIGAGAIFRIPISRTLTAAAIAAGIFLFLLWFSSRAWQQGGPAGYGKGPLFAAEVLFLSGPGAPAVQMKTPVLFPSVSRVPGGVTGTGPPFFSTVAPAYGPEAPPFLPRQTAVFLVPTGGALLRLFPIRPFGRHFSARHVAAPVGKLARHAGAFFVGPWKTLTSLSALFQTADLVGQPPAVGLAFFIFPPFLGACGPAAFTGYGAAFCCGRAFGRPAAPSLPPGGWFRCCRHGGPPGPLPAAVWLSHCGAVRNVKLFMSLCPRRFSGFGPQVAKRRPFPLYTSYLWLPSFWLGLSLLWPVLAWYFLPSLFLLSFFLLPPAIRFWTARWYSAGLPFFQNGRHPSFLRPGAVGYIPAG